MSPLCPTGSNVPLAGDSRAPLYATVVWADPRMLTLGGRVPRTVRRRRACSGCWHPRTLVSPYWYPGDPLPADRFPAALAELVVRACGTATDRPSLTERAGTGRSVAQTTGTVVEPTPVGDLAAVRPADRWVFAADCCLVRS